MSTRDFQAVTTLEDLSALLTELQRDPTKTVAFDVETGYSTPDPVEKRALDIYHPDFFVVGMSITTDTSWARYIPLRHDTEQFFDPKEVWEKLRPVFEQQTILAHHKKFEDKILRALPSQGDALSPIRTRIGHDSMLSAYVLGEFQESSLKALSSAVLGEEQATFASLFDGPDGPAKPAVVKRARFNQLPPTAPHVVSYACDDAALCLALHDIFQERLSEDQRRMYSIEMAISAMMVEAEEFGVGVAWEDMERDRKNGKTFRPIYEATVREHLGGMSNDPRIREKAKSVNFGSSLQMRELLYTDLGLSTTRTTPKGELSTDAQALETLARRHVGIRGLLSYRETSNLAKRLDKWLDEYSQSRDGRVHPTFSQTRVISGRFSANDPAIQQLPKQWLWSTENDEEFNPIEVGENGKGHWAGNFREFVAAKDDHYLLTFDYSQQELRVLAGLTQDPTLLSAFAQGIDPHVATASMMLGVPVEQVSKDQRAIGKTLNFAILYGMGPKSMAERLAISLDEAKALMAQYFSQFQNVDSWISYQKSKGMQQKFVTTWLGRTVPLFQAWSSSPGHLAQAERLSVNAPIQGGAADYTKLAMLRSKMVLQQAGLWGDVILTMNQHDSLTFEVRNSVDPNTLRQMLQQAVVFDPRPMFPGMQVPNFPTFEVDWEIGLTWGESREWADDSPPFEWDEGHQQWLRGQEMPMRRPDTSTKVLEEPEQVVLTLEPIDTVESSVVPAEEPAPEEEAEVAPEKILRVGFPTSDPTVLATFKKLLAKTDGSNGVQVRVGDGEWMPTGYKTCLTDEDRDRIRLAVPDAYVEMGD